MSVNIKPFIIINGTNSNDITGLMITKLPPISKPAMRVEAEEIDGRDGDLVTELGYSAYDKEIEIGLVGDYDVNDVIAFFNTSGQVVFSNEPDFFYRFAIYNAIDFEKLIRFKTATVTFHVQPFKFETDSNDSVHFNPSSFNITNEGNIYSRPELAIQGSGDVGIAVNGSDVLEIALGENRQAIIIDSEAMNAYGTRSNIKNVDVEINPVQDLHGFDSPWAGGAGKNKFDCNANYNLPINNQNGVTVTLGDDGLLHFSGTCSANFSIYGINQSYYSVLGSPVKFTVFGASETMVCVPFKNNNSATAITTDGGVSTAFANTENDVFYLRIDLKAGTNYNGKTLGIIFSLASETFTSFSPYENICPITGWNECNLTHTGKNLSPSQPIQYTTTNYGVILVWLKAGTYTASYVGGESQFYVRTSSPSDTTITSGTEISHSSTYRNNYTFTIPNDGYYKIQLYRASGTPWSSVDAPSKFQIETGTTASSYEGYAEETFTEEFEQDGQPVTVFGGVINLTTGLLTIDKAIGVYNGTENWQADTSRNGVYLLFSTMGTHVYGIGYCDRLKTITNSSEMNALGIAFGINNYAIYIPHLFDSVSGITDVASWKTYLSNNNMQVCYPLATPIEIQLTAEEIHSFIGENVFWADTGAISDLSYTKGDADISTSGDIVSFEIDARDLIDTVLKNRIVTGNYDNLRLKAGQNQIEVTGNVDVLVLSNFSRWL